MVGVEQKALNDREVLFDCFPPQRADAFLQCFGDRERQERLFSARDPYSVAQREMFALRFLPDEPDKVFQKKLETLRRCLNLTTAQVVEGLTGNSCRDEVVAAARNVFQGRLNYLMEKEAELEKGDCLFPRSKSSDEKLREIYGLSENNIPFERWLSGYLFVLWDYYADIAKFKLDFLAGYYPRKESLDWSLLNESCRSHYLKYPEMLDYKVRFLGNTKERTLTHGLSGLSLRLQIFLGAIGDFLTARHVCLAGSRVFVPMPTMFLDDPEKWIVFFDPGEIKEAGLPVLIGGESTEENEVKVLPPISLSLSIGAFPIGLIEKLGWEDARSFWYPHQRNLIIPRDYRNAWEVAEFLRKKFKEADSF